MENSSEDLEIKTRELYSILRGCGSVVVGYSGGVDSVFLAKAALIALGRDNVLAVIGRSPSYPAAQHQVAVKAAELMGLPLIEMNTGELEDTRYVSNPTHRCYFCKTELYSQLRRVAQERGFEVVLDGSNADDLDDHRPGLAAARELGVRSPLQEAGLRKDEIRGLSRRLGLPTWDLPSSPCLASRIPYGLAVTRRRLREIEAAEAGLRALGGWRNLRVRHHGDRARLEIDVADLAKLADADFRRRVAAVFKGAGFAQACVDLRGYRRGALNEPDQGMVGMMADRAATAQRRLAGIGAAVEVERAEDIALIRCADESGPLFLGELRTSVIQECEAAGYRYVAVELYST